MDENLALLFKISTGDFKVWMKKQLGLLFHLFIK